MARTRCGSFAGDAAAGRGAGLTGVLAAGGGAGRTKGWGFTAGSGLAGTGLVKAPRR